MDYTIIFEAMLALIAAIITAYLVPYIKSKTTAEEQTAISAWVDVAVAAAEQLFDSEAGAEKLAYVVDFLKGLGFTVTTQEIESAVYWLHDAVTQETTEEVEGGE